MKKSAVSGLFALLLAACLLFSLTGCFLPDEIPEETYKERAELAADGVAANTTAEFRLLDWKYAEALHDEPGEDYLLPYGPGEAFETSIAADEEHRILFASYSITNTGDEELDLALWALSFVYDNQVAYSIKTPFTCFKTADGWASGENGDLLAPGETREYRGYAIPAKSFFKTDGPLRFDIDMYEPVSDQNDGSRDRKYAGYFWTMSMYSLILLES